MKIKLTILSQYVSKKNAFDITQKCFFNDIDNTFKSPIARAFTKSKVLLRISRKIMVKDANTHDENLGFRYS